MNERYVEIPVRFPLGDWDRLQAQCDREELSERQLVRKAVRFYLEDRARTAAVLGYEGLEPHIVNVRVRDGIL